MMKRIVLCADDYGQAPSISAGICQLIEKKRLSATSCMVNTIDWLTHAKWLIPYVKHIDIGLHCNFTEGKPLSSAYQDEYGNIFLSLKKLLARAVLKQIDKQIIVAELNAQIDCFVDALGFLPRFLDGHQHVHQFPIIRDAVLQVYETRLREQKAYIRAVNMKWRLMDLFKERKKIVIYATGSAVFSKKLRDAHVPHNTSFAGVYSFARAKSYRDYFLNFLAMSSDRGLIMCHPGLLDTSSDDVIKEARFQEYQYLISDDCARDLLKRNVIIAPF